MVDTLVSGASASRHVGSSPIIRTLKEEESDDSSSFAYIGSSLSMTAILAFGSLFSPSFFI